MSKIIKEHTTVGVDGLISAVEDGLVRIPHFQRGYEWTLEDVAFLMQSIFLDIPLGNLVYWQTSVRLQSERTIGAFELGQGYAPYSYVLDGQQRVTSIFAALKGLELVNSKRRRLNFKNIYVDLRKNPEEFDFDSYVHVIRFNVQDYHFPVYKLFSDEYEDERLAIELLEYRRNASIYNKKLNQARFEVEKVTTEETPIAIQVFQAINVGGTKLSSESIVSAILFDDENNWYFREKAAALHEELKAKGFDRFVEPTSSLFPFLSYALFGKTQKLYVQQLTAELVIPMWDHFCRSMHLSVDYLKNRYKIKNEKYIFSKNVLYHTFYFFYHNRRNPTAHQSKELDRLFFSVGSSLRYFASTASRMEHDLRYVKMILRNESLPEDEVGLRLYDHPELIEEIVSGASMKSSSTETNTTNGFYLLLLSMRNPKSFNTGLDVINVSEDQINGLHRHHVFPHSVYGKPSYNVFNLLLLDADTNQQLSNRKPADYISEYENNSDFKEIMESHFIGERELEDMRRDDLESFKQHRAENIYRWMNEYLSIS